VVVFLHAMPASQCSATWCDGTGLGIGLFDGNASLFNVTSELQFETQVFEFIMLNIDTFVEKPSREQLRG